MKHSRREFLILTTGFMVMSASPTLSAKFSLDSIPKVVIEPHQSIGLSKKQWQIMAQVQEHLFPSEENAPGAKDVYATAWLHNALLMPNVDQKHIQFIRNGLINLEKLSQTSFQKELLTLDEAQRETLLREYEQNHTGNAWIREILRYIFEALLSDPVYGSNHDGIGWKWLKHKHGFPLPPKDKRYYLL
ncbi:gluconate 2-dehydrogenase subunit 3 family protein [Candidatus Halobeggiatoa sp. HSG11]|nr:gluconate 2-dehydrogenase subunit 3 family protein [Candidatus Halobeggiatoa sp. HSG11]